MPNPATDELTLSELATAGVTIYQITDMTGRQLLNGQLSGNQRTMAINDIPAGSYILKLVNAETSGTNIMFVKK